MIPPPPHTQHTHAYARTHPRINVPHHMPEQQHRLTPSDIKLKLSPLCTPRKGTSQSVALACHLIFFATRPTVCRTPTLALRTTLLIAASEVKACSPHRCVLDVENFDRLGKKWCHASVRDSRERVDVVRSAGPPRKRSIKEKKHQTRGDLQ
jgi:hypothetical protein